MNGNRHTLVLNEESPEAIDNDSSLMMQAALPLAAPLLLCSVRR